MKLAIGTLVIFLVLAESGRAQTDGTANLAAMEVSATSQRTAAESYAIFNATPTKEAALRAKIQLMHPDVLPLRVFFLPHWKYLDTARIFLLHVPDGYRSLMFTQLPSRTVFIDNDQYQGEEWLGYWMAHELGHLKTNSAKESDAEWAAREYRKRLKQSANRGALARNLHSAVVIIPWAASGRLKEFALKNNGDLREEISWEDLVRAVADARDGLTAQQKQNFGVVVGNYGEGGAITILGREYHLPPAVQLTNSGWWRGYPVPPPDTLIVVGWSHRQLEEAFGACGVSGRNGSSLGVKNEESEDHPCIYVCGPPKRGWAEFWRTHQRFG